RRWRRPACTKSSYHRQRTERAAVGSVQPELHEQRSEEDERAAVGSQLTMKPRQTPRDFKFSQNLFPAGPRNLAWLRTRLAAIQKLNPCSFPTRSNSVTNSSAVWKRSSGRFAIIFSTVPSNRSGTAS